MPPIQKGGKEKSPSCIGRGYVKLNPHSLEDSVREILQSRTPFRVRRRGEGIGGDAAPTLPIIGRVMKRKRGGNNPLAIRGERREKSKRA